jgi:hypothetical protein
MRKTMTLTMAATGWFGGHTLAAADQVQVYVRFGSGANLDGSMVCAAQQQASKLLLEAGVVLDWRRGAPAEDVAGPETVVVLFVPNAPRDQDRNALAVARPYGSSSELSVFNDRVTAYVQNVLPTDRGRILGHVLAHEIVHVLEGVARHSDTGLMTAHWTWREMRAAITGGLHLAEEDRRLVAYGIQARCRRATLTASAAVR